MTASVFFRSEVNDFATWKKVYDESAQEIKETGVITNSVHRDPDDPNTIIICHQYADLNTAQGFMTAVTTGGLQPAFKKSGVKPETIQMWVGEAV